VRSSGPADRVPPCFRPLNRRHGVSPEAFPGGSWRWRHPGSCAD
jgi:hypothetical protein